MSLIGRSIGHIRIEGLLGRGGMGEVYVGYDETLQRRVAVKAVSPVYRLSHERKARFLREARALSRLDHPNICKIYDFVESEGADYLVLEYVEGASLGRAIASGIDRPGRLKIALEIARVLVVAHGKGIVHRDLKPANIKLTPEGEIKVLDFGLARFLEAGHTPSAGPSAEAEHEAGENRSAGEGAGPPGPIPPSTPPLSPLGGPGPLRAAQSAKTMTLSTPSSPLPGSRYSDQLAASAPTEQGAVMGTPYYMSPEQARGERITTASDMFSFGLILQEIFTGRPCHDATEDPTTLLSWAKTGESRPVKGLSADLTSLINRLKSRSAAARPTAVETVERLERIKDKPRRRLRRLIVGAVATAFLLAGVKYALDLGRERRQALQARDEAANVVKFLVNLFSVSDPGEARGNSITAREVLDKGAKEISQGLEKQPLTRARMMDAIGTVYRKLGLYDKSEPLVRGALDIREKSLPADDLQVADSLLSLGALRQVLGRYKESRDLYQRSLDIRSKALPADDPLIADAQIGLGEILFQLTKLPEAEALFKRSLEIREKALGPDHPDVARSLMDLGWLYYDSSRFAEAQSMYKRSLAILEKGLGPDHPDVAECLSNLGGLCLWQRRFGESEAYYQRALAIREKDLGPDHPQVAGTYDHLGLVYEYQNRFPEARAYAEKALAIRLKAQGPEHPDVGDCYFSLAVIEHRQGDLKAAEASYLRAIAIYEKTVGPEDVNLTTPLGNLADIRLQAGRLQEAEALLKRALSIREKAFGAGHVRVNPAINALAHFYVMAGRTGEAAGLYATALDRLEKEGAGGSFSAAEPLWGLALCCRIRGDQARGLAYLARAEALCEKEGEIDETLWGLVTAERAWHQLHEDKDLGKAEASFKRALELMGREIPLSSLEFREPVREYAALLTATGRAKGARSLLAKYGLLRD
jgi:serine/threonine protein kinase/Tfp pilus assembly protein PilF